ncbi:NUP43 [Scenedesmus sp. PABB004]|nr:NUP43 [Scenedesmus sp. PABB004]
MLQYVPKLTIKHPGAITDLQVSRIEDSILAASSSAAGGVCLLMMQLPPAPGATSADLQFVLAPGDGDDDGGSDDGEGGGYLHELPALHDCPAASLDINAVRQSLLSVAGDGSICVVPLDALAQLGGDCCFRSASGWSGFSQGRWVDSNSFATAGVLGGLQVWDVRRGPSPVSNSPLAWGHTGCAALDKQQGAARQMLCLGVHPSRPNLAATGASGGCVALWDLRFASAPLALAGAPGAAGDVWELRFDPCEPLMSSSVAAVPPLLYCTSDGALACAAAAARPGGAGGGTGGLTAQVLLKDSCSVNSFDVEPSGGQDIVAVTDAECMLLLSRRAVDS